MGFQLGNCQSAAPGKMIIGRRTIRTPGALGPFWAAAGRVTVLSRQYTFPIDAFMGCATIWQAENRARDGYPASSLANDTLRQEFAQGKHGKRMVNRIRALLREFGKSNQRLRHRSLAAQSMAM